MNRKPYARIIYNGKDITSDISEYLLRVVVVDKQLQKTGEEKAESDELTIELEDTDGLWRAEWMPQKQDRLTVEIGYEDEVYSFGTFEVDEIEFSGPPDTVSLRAIAAGISKKLRTKRSTAHEGKTLRQIAQSIASANGLTVEGEIEDIQIGRVTQDRETDLAFLERIARTYGYMFSVRDSKCVFTNIFDIHRADSVLTIDRTEVSSYSIKSSTVDTKASAKVSYTEPASMEEIEYEWADGGEEGMDYSSGEIEKRTAEDVLEIRTRVENKQQAERVARTALHAHNSKQVTGSLSMDGRPTLMAGINFEFTGMRKLSGKYNIEQATHTVERGGGYSVSLEIKKVGNLSDSSKEVPLDVRQNQTVQVN